MSTDLDHVFLTRFNLPSEGAESLIRAREDWLTERIALFERYTVPSLMSLQTCPDFRWIIYLDPQSPAWLKAKMETLASDSRVHPIFRERVDHEDLAADLLLAVGRPAGHLLTTNLDNDDGLAVDFVERLQQVRTTLPRMGIYMRHGLIKSSNGVYLRDDPVNAFCSVWERWDASPLTCWSEWHNLLAQRMPTEAVDGPPAWLQVIHDQNVSNRVRGRLVSPMRHRGRFGGLIDDVPEPDAGMVWRDRLVAQPQRAARESARRVVKETVLKVGGRDALDRVKLRLASRT
ncbi:glycosyltransferase [Nocardioides sambongensis]|uniref:glycosyltransferase n=1 Tax=Nocardioides sambongensis TaxID=2589074 RepID=UPI001127B0D2|nr:glycosyltransferase [Nocardioides sambongensis]